MPEAYPPLEPVRTRGASAQHPSGAQGRVGFEKDATTAFAHVLTTLGHQPAANRVGDLASRIYRERTASMLDDLAEVWWRAEHGADEGARVRPFASLPIADRAELRARVKKLLAERVPDALGDQAVLDAERQRLLDLPARALRRAAADLERVAERDRAWAGSGATADAAIFAAGQVSIVHIGDGRVVRLRRGKLDALTRAHDLTRLYAERDLGVPDARRAAELTHALGMAGDAAVGDAAAVAVERGDLLLLLNGALGRLYDGAKLHAILLAEGLAAPARLVADVRSRTEAYVGAVAVEIL